MAVVRNGNYIYIDSINNPLPLVGAIPLNGDGTIITGGNLKADYNATLPPFTDGTSAPLQIDNRGSLFVRIGNGLTSVNVSNPSDSFANATGLSVNAQNLVWDGTQWVRTKSIVSTLSATAGIPAAGLCAVFDDVSRQFVVEGNTLALRMGTNHSLIVQQNGSEAEGFTYAAAASGIVASTTGITAKASAGAGLRNYVDSVQVMWDTLASATDVQIRDGAAGTVLWRGKCQTVAGQLAVVFNKPLRGAAATLLEIALGTSSATGGVYINLQGHVGE